MEYKALPTLAYTHFQAAQPTTVGKRACLWMNDLLFDIEQLDFQLNNLKLLGCKGTTGTGASFLELFDGKETKVEQLEQKIAEKSVFQSVRVSVDRPIHEKLILRFYRYCPELHRVHQNSPVISVYSAT